MRVYDLGFRGWGKRFPRNVLSTGVLLWVCLLRGSLSHSSFKGFGVPVLGDLGSNVLRT